MAYKRSLKPKYPSVYAPAKGDGTKPRRIKLMSPAKQQRELERAANRLTLVRPDEWKQRHSSQVTD
jgi:hypothetical protein